MSKTFTIDREMEFKGDIIITDPCYIIRKESQGISQITDDDWEACNYGEKMEALGINHYMTRDTIYGDWGCTTIKGYIDGKRTSSLTTPIANNFYGWLKDVYAYGNADSFPKDICSLRKLYYESE